jgi:hypothetical protein
MIREDFVIQSEIRRMLIRSNIDYTKIDLGTVKGVVYFRGIFRPYLPPQLRSEESIRLYIEKTLLALEKKIRSIPGVSDVIFQFNNWKKEKGRWFPTQSIRKEEKKEEKKIKRKEEEGEKTVEDQMDSKVSTNFE